MRALLAFVRGARDPFHRRRRAFTLLEMVIVLSIVGIMGGIALVSVRRSRNRVEIDRSVASLRAEVERVRALSRTAGSRLGTARMSYDGTCPGALGGNLLWVRILPGANQVILPRTIAYDDANDELDVTCAPWNFGGTGSAGADVRFLAPAAPVTFAFSANGRLAFPPGAPAADVFVALQHADESLRTPGFRVLPAGVTCVASNPDPLVAPCDEDIP